VNVCNLVAKEGLEPGQCLGRTVWDLMRCAGLEFARAVLWEGSHERTAHWLPARCGRCRRYAAE
jgi:hypothetical protein